MCISKGSATHESLTWSYLVRTGAILKQAMLYGKRFRRESSNVYIQAMLYGKRVHRESSNVYIQAGYAVWKTCPT